MPAELGQPLLSLAPYIAPQVPPCPNPIIEQQIRRAAIELCNNSRYWKRTHNPELLDYQPEYYHFGLSSQEDRNQLEWVTWDNTQLTPTSEEQLAKHNPKWTEERCLTPTHYLEMENRCIKLWPLPPVDTAAHDPKQVSIRMSIRPSLNATTMDSGVMQDCYNVLVNGALGFLMSMNAQPWGNPELALGYMANFQSGVDLYTRRARDSNVVPIRTVKFNSGY
jgi:hypothetical protein